jgi:hypothetical protein
MEFNEITSITGKGGLFHMKVHRPDGMIVTSLSEGWTRLVSSRNHLFTPLKDIAIYTESDTVPLLDVLKKIKSEADSNPIPGSKASSDELKSFMENLVPEYDKERVYVSDMKKLLKWYAILDKHGIIDSELNRKEGEEGSEESASEAAADSAEAEKKS